MTKLTIDGKEVDVEPGTTVIRAAERIGITIPHYCWHPGLTVAGNCRMCLVEIEKIPKLAIACSTTAADGMVVRTTVERVRQARDAIMEFLLINHPLDCPICDQAGECRLQEYSFRYGAGGSRFLEEKVHKPKNVDIGEHIVFDAERCILCTRCVRFCEEVSKTGELTVANRGDHVTIETFPGLRLDNPYSGNTVDICPVGALTLKEFRFKQRVWFLKDVPSICPGCARGCNVNDAISSGRILRITPRVNLEVNRWWICDEGRLSYEKLYRGGRIVWARLAPRFAEMEGRETAAYVASVPRTDGAAAAAESAAVSKGSAAGSAAPRLRVIQPDPSVAGFIPKLNEGVPPAPRGFGPNRRGETVMVAALDAAARALREAHAEGGPGSVEFVLSSRATNEDVFFLGRLARDQFGAARVALPEHDHGTQDDVLIRSDRTPNRTGALAVLAGLGLAVEAGSDLTLRVGSGNVKAVVAIGPNLVGNYISPAARASRSPADGRSETTAEQSKTTAGQTEAAVGDAIEAAVEALGRRADDVPSGAPAPPWGEERRYRRGERGLFEALAVAAEAAGVLLVVIDAFESPLAARAAIVLPALTYGEIEGTYTNFERRVQRVRTGLAPAADGLPVYRIAQEIGRRLGVDPGGASARAAFSALAAEIPAFGGLTYPRIGQQGAFLAGETPAP